MLRAVPFDVLVVLGCRVQGEHLSHAALRRVERAAQAYREEGATLVVASGGKSWQGVQECRAFAQGLLARGVAPEHVIEESESLTTRGNARGVASLLRHRNVARLGLVTCDWHMARALLLFERVGLKPIPVPAASPKRGLRKSLARSLRERVSLAFELLLGPLLVLLVLSGCSKTSGQAPDKAASVPATSASVSAQKLASLLQAELRRDPRGVADDDLIAEEAPRRLAAVRSLARIADERSFAPLERALADEDPTIIGWAAFGVGQLCRGHEPEASQHLALRAASLVTTPVSSQRDQAFGALALGLGRCASDEAEKSLRAWLKLSPPLADSAALGLGQIARRRKHLDEATVAALLDLAAQAPTSSALYPIESLPALGPAARQRLLEVAGKSLDQPGPGRGFAIRALGKAGADAAPVLRHLLEAQNVSAAESADAARSLSALGAAGQADLAEVLKGRERALIDGKAWLSDQHGVVLTLLDGLEPKRGDPSLLLELAQLPLQGEPAAVARRKVMLRCRAASLLAGRASESPTLAACDPAPPAERREGSLALLKVLARGPLTAGRAARFTELGHSPDRVVREAALELLQTHDEAPNIPELLASALSAKEVGVRATAAKVLSQYPSRAQVASAPSGEPAGDIKATPPTDPRVVQALTQQLTEVGVSTNIEVSASLLDAAAALELLGAKPALERACSSSNPTLREHAVRGFAALGEPKHACSSVPGTGDFSGAVADYRVDFETDVGPLSLTLDGGASAFATARFVELARSGFFDGMLVHRVVPGFVVQFGDPDGDGFGGPSLPPLRCQLSGEAFQPGSVGVALAGRDTGLSQFFVTLRRAPHLDGEYSLIGSAGPGWEKLAAGDRILKATVLEADGK